METLAPSLPAGHTAAVAATDTGFAINPGEVVAAFAPTATRARLVIIDDDPTNLRVARAYLRRAGYPLVFTYEEPLEALAALQRMPPDLVLTDINMPGLSGLELLRRMRQNPALALVPVVCLSASLDVASKRQALEHGAYDFLSKPFDPAELLPRVRNALLLKSYQDDLRTRTATLESEVRARTLELEESRREVIHRLARAAEFRDNETGRHVVRVGKYAAILAAELGCDKATCELIELAAPLHDIGKIGIPDAILLKPGRLTADEYTTMKQHAAIGERIVGPMADDDWAARIGTLTRQHGVSNVVPESPVLAMAGRIAATHHERWDGSGYPRGLAGEAIPLEGRITSVADVFDALCSARPYKPAFPLSQCLAILEEGRDTQFDGRVLDAFLNRQAEILAVRDELAD